MKDFDSVFDISFNDNSTNIDVDSETMDVYLDIEDDFFTKTNSSVNIYTDYNKLINMPSIEGVTLIGDKTFDQLNFSIGIIDCGTSTLVV